MNATPDFTVPQRSAREVRVPGSTGMWHVTVRHLTVRHVAVGAVAALCAFLLYLSGVSSTVTYGGDCGELIAASYRLGIAHPTGYALYCLLGRCFASLLPLGEVGWRYNVLSAVFGALSVGLVTATVYHLVDSGFGNRADVSHEAERDTLSSTRNSVLTTALQNKALWPALGAGLLLAGFYDFWTQCVLAEVYALNALMLSALIYAAVAWHQSADWRWFFSLAVLFGLALNAHLSCVYLAPGLLLYTVVQHRARFGTGFKAVRKFAVALAFMLAAYALTLYSPLRSSLFPEPPPVSTASTRIAVPRESKPAQIENAPRETEWWPLDWTHPADFSRWYAHASAKQYKNLLFARYAVPLGDRTIHVTWFAQSLPSLWTGLALWAAHRGFLLVVHAVAASRIVPKLA
jgi:hypothetical protein